jgi:hypothetical protein
MAVGYLRVRFELQRDVVAAAGIRGTDGRSATFLPGRALRGMASTILAGSELHEQVVLSGAVSFTPALPVARNQNYQKFACVPMPACVRQSRDTSTLQDLSDPSLVPEPDLQRPAADWAVLDDTGRILGTVAVGQQVWTRIQRDRTRSRPAETPVDTGGPFHTVAVAAGQVFEARWRLHAADDAGLVPLAEDVFIVLHGETARIGRAKDTAHGGHAILDVDEKRCERVIPVSVPDAVDGTELWVLLLAPALVTDPVTGEYDPGALGDTVAAHFEHRVEAISTWVTPVVVGGYNALWRGFLPEAWAAAGGSVVRVRVKAGHTLTGENITEYEHTPLGRQHLDGYGAFAVLPVPTQNSPLACYVPAASMRQECAADIAQPPPYPGLTSELLTAATSALAWPAIEAAIDRGVVASVAASADGLPTASLLGRLREPLASAESHRDAKVATSRLQALIRLQGTFAGPARKQLADSMIRSRPKTRPVNLGKWLTQLSTDPGALTRADNAVAAADPAGPAKTKEPWLRGATGAVERFCVTVEPENSSVAAGEWLQDNAAGIAARYLHQWVRLAAKNRDRT